MRPIRIAGAATILVFVGLLGFLLGSGFPSFGGTRVPTAYAADCLNGTPTPYPPLDGAHPPWLSACLRRQAPG